MIKIGLTGNIASGKSLVEDFLLEMDVPVVDADKIVHDLYSEKSFADKISALFEGEDIFENGKLSRAKIGKIVFNDKNKMKKLEEILHPEVINRINIFFEENKDRDIAVASVPLLFEENLEKLFDCIVTVFVDNVNQINRLIKRNNLTKDEAMSRINSQMSIDEKAKKSDFIINNSGTPDGTKEQLVIVLNQIKEGVG